MAIAVNKGSLLLDAELPEPVSSFPSLACGERWYVVQTLPCREDGSSTQREALGFPTFLSRYAKTMRRARRFTTVTARFFLRYLFVALDLGCDRWRGVNGTFGVVSRLTANERPIGGAAGERLAAPCCADVNLRLAETLAVGQRIKILNGPFANFIGELARIDAGGGAKVLTTLGRRRADLRRPAGLDTASKILTSALIACRERETGRDRWVCWLWVDSPEVR